VHGAVELSGHLEELDSICLGRFHLFEIMDNYKYIDKDHDEHDQHRNIAGSYPCLKFHVTPP